MSKKTMLSIGEIVHAENSRAKNAKVERRAHWSGKLRAVPAVLLSSLLLVTGAAGAQANVDMGKAVKEDGPSSNSSQLMLEQLTAKGGVDIQDHGARFVLEMMDGQGNGYRFEGDTPNKEDQTGLSYFSGTVTTPDFARMVKDTNSFKYESVGTNTTITFLINKKVYTGKMVIAKVPKLTGPQFGMGQWTAKMLSV